MTVRPPADRSSAGLAVTVAAAEDAKPEPKLTPNLATEPVAAKLSLKKAAEFLDNASLAWTRDRKCGTCHTNYPYLMARVHLKEGSSDPVNEVRKFFEDRAANWDSDVKGAKPRWDTEVVATAAALAINDAMTTGKLHPLTRKALDRAWTLQQKDGSWDWPRDWPPMEHDDYYGPRSLRWASATPRRLRKERVGEGGAGETARLLQEDTAADLHHKAMLLWASVRPDGLMSDADRKATVKELRALQHRTGLEFDVTGGVEATRRHANTHTDSDGYATGLAVVARGRASRPTTNRSRRR
jgi:squalene-hopene/tetraprenyl-beta-curcumene cyclase